MHAKSVYLSSTGLQAEELLAVHGRCSLIVGVKRTVKVLRHQWRADVMLSHGFTFKQLLTTAIGSNGETPNVSMLP
jgi:hypothetical protein